MPPLTGAPVAASEGPRTEIHAPELLLASVCFAGVAFALARRLAGVPFGLAAATGCGRVGSHSPDSLYPASQAGAAQAAT